MEPPKPNQKGTQTMNQQLDERTLTMYEMLWGESYKEEDDSEDSPDTPKDK